MPPKAAPRRGAPARRNITSVSDAPTESSSQNPSQESQTPAPTASRPPVRRLQSLNRRAPTGSITPASRTPGPGLPGEQPAKPTLKYKPKAVGRRSKEEREAIEKREAERNRERLAEAAAKQRGRGGSGFRGRGGLGFGRGGGVAGGADGPLGSGSAARRGRGGRVGSDRISSVSRSRTRSVMGVSGANGGRDASSDESDTEVRVSMDHINIESSDEGEEFEGKVASKKGKIPVRGKREKGLRPVRVEGHEHKDRVVSVNMESSTNKSSTLREEAKKKAETDDALFVEQEPEKGQDGKAQEPRIKQEPQDEDQIMTEAIPHAEEVAHVDDGLPEQKVKVRRRLTSKEPPVVDEQPEIPDPKSLLRTAEDLEEFERHENDLDEIKKLFTADEEKEKAQEPRPGPQPSTEEGEEAGEQEKSEEEEEAKDKLAGHMFLVQFPPMTPNLLVPTTEGKATDSAPAGAGQEDTQADGGNPPQTEVTKLENGEDGQEEETAPQEPPKLVTATDRQLQAGRVGKMNVHASGRVTLDWGGISFELDRSTEVDFLQEALIMSNSLNAEVEETPEEENRVWSMGQLSGKFTVTPDWSKIL